MFVALDTHDSVEGIPPWTSTPVERRCTPVCQTHFSRITGPRARRAGFRWTAAVHRPYSARNRDRRHKWGAEEGGGTTAARRDKHLGSGGGDDDVSGRLDPRFSVHLHRNRFTDSQTDVVPLSDPDPRSHPALHLALHVHTHTHTDERDHVTGGWGRVRVCVLDLTMWTTPVTPTTSSRPSSMRGFP